MLPGRSLENTLSRLPLSRWSSPSDRFHALSRTPPRNAEGGRIASSPDSPSTIVSRPSANFAAISAPRLPGIAWACCLAHSAPERVLPNPRPASISQTSQSPTGARCAGRAICSHGSPPGSARSSASVNGSGDGGEVSAYGVVSALLLLTAGPHRLDRHPQQPPDQFALPFGELDLPLGETGRQRGTAYLHEVGPLFLVQLDPHAGTLEHRAALAGGVLLQPAPVQVADVCSSDLYLGALVGDLDRRGLKQYATGESAEV